MSTNDVTFDENLLYAPADDPDVFPAEIVPNQTSEHLRLSGRYELHVNTANLALVDMTTRKPVFTWPFRYIRRYGAGKDYKFQFEAGRRCPSGEGLFLVDVSPQRGEAVFECIQKRLNVMRERDLQYQSDASAVGPASSGRPVVPDRQFSHSNYQNLPAAVPATGSGGGKEGAKKPTAATTKKVPDEVVADKKAGSAKSKPASTSAAAVQSKAPPVSARALAAAARSTPEEAMYAEVDMSGPPRGRADIVGGATAHYSVADDPPPLYSVVVKPSPPQARVAAAAPAAGRAPPSAAAVAAPSLPPPPSDVNRLIAERRASLRRLDADDAEGYGTVSSVRAAVANGAAAASAAQPPAAEYGCVPPHPTAGQQYSLVTPQSDYDAVDEAYATTESFGRPSTGARSRAPP